MEERSSRLVQRQQVLNKDMSVEEILDVMEEQGEFTWAANAGAAILQWQLHKELLSEQEKYQKSHLKWTAWLVGGTWALVLATWFLAWRP